MQKCGLRNDAEVVRCASSSCHGDNVSARRAADAEQENTEMQGIKRDAALRLAFGTFMTIFRLWTSEKEVMPVCFL